MVETSAAAAFASACWCVPPCPLQPIPVWKNPAELEPSSHMMIVEDPSKPADVRFLHVLQVTDAAAANPTPAVLLTGSVNGGAAGTAHGEREAPADTTAQRRRGWQQRALHSGASASSAA